MTWVFISRVFKVYAIGSLKFQTQGDTEQIHLVSLALIGLFSCMFIFHSQMSYLLIDLSNGDNTERMVQKHHILNSFIYFAILDY